MNKDYFTSFLISALCYSTLFTISGEGKVPTNYMRDEHFDVKAFPCMHPTGRFGLHHKRSMKLSPVYYFNQRLLNKDQRFAKNIPYIFMAQQYLERHTLESQINVCSQRGTVDHQNLTPHSDVFSVFQKLKGSPKYWKQVCFCTQAKY